VRFEAVVAEMYEPLQRYFGRRAPRDDVPELVNDTLLVMWRRLDDVPIEQIQPWSFGVARHCLANKRRSARRRVRLVDRLTAYEAVAPHEPGVYSGHPELEMAELEMALGGLDDVAHAIRSASQGHVILGAGAAQRLLTRLNTPGGTMPIFPELTERERDVLRLVADGGNNQAIARALSLSPKTIANHVSNILTKLQIADRAEAIVRARRAGLVPDRTDPL
jgi:DNA-binding CsgD family transcriptional regulator